MKQFKNVISVLLAVVLIATAFAACKDNKKDSKKKQESATVTVAVTDENGETVTDKNGETVTEVISADDASAASQGGVVKVEGSTAAGNAAGASNGGNNTSKSSNGKNGNNNNNAKNTSKNTIKKPAAPATPKLSVGEITKDSVTLSWNAVKCNAYQLQYRLADGTWQDAAKKTSATKITLKNLQPYTDYEFRLRAYNENKAGVSASKWATAKAKTKEDEKYNRKINISVQLPYDSNEDDTLRIYVRESGAKKWTLVEESKVKCNKTVHEFTTKDKFKGLVEVRAELVNHKASSSTKTNGDSCKLEITVGIDTEYDEL